MARTQISDNLFYRKSVYLQSILRILTQYILLLLPHTDSPCHLVYKNLASTHCLSRIRINSTRAIKKSQVTHGEKCMVLLSEYVTKIQFYTVQQYKKREITRKIYIFPKNLSESFRSHFDPSQPFLVGQESVLYCTSFNVLFLSPPISLSALKD